MDSFDDISRGGLSAGPPPADGADLYPTGFGRGWIPAGRDIGVGDEILPGTGRWRAEGPTEGALGDGPVWCSDASPLHHPADGPPPRSGEELALPLRRDGWTPALKARFLDALAGHGNVRAACASVGMSAEAAYRLRRREALFAQGWAAALVVARGHAEQVLADRAMHGVTEPIFYRGEQVGARVRFDSRLLLAHLARLDRAAEDEIAAEHAERFDELVALVAGARPDAAMFAGEHGAGEASHVGADDLLPLARAAYVDKARAEAEGAVLWDIDDPLGGEAGGDYEDEDENDDPVWTARESAGAAAGARWDAWNVQARTVADSLSEIRPGPGSGSEILPELARGGGPSPQAMVEGHGPFPAHPSPSVEADGPSTTRCAGGPPPRDELGEDLGPIEFKSLDPVNRVNFAAAPGAWPAGSSAGSSGQFREAGRIPPCGQGQTWALAAARR